MSEEKTEVPIETEDVKWRDQPKDIKRILLGVLLLLIGIVWVFLEQKSDSRWVIFNIIYGSWFTVVAGALTLLGEMIKKPKKSPTTIKPF